jgi:Nucleotidyl transferase AbiEii toxin, Type IV TA system
VEKDYYVTKVLRIVADAYREKVIFKGRTSLSKGWALIDRFSEDVDLFVDPARFDPPLQSARVIDRELRALRDRVAGHPGLERVPALGQTIGGRGRADHLAYATRFDAFLREQGQHDIAEDLAPFAMTLLHFRRTFVEKLFTIHSKVMRLLEDGTPVARDARHYADLHALAQRPEVLAMLESDEYGEIRRDYDALSSRWFPRSHRPPAELSFRKSPALFPPAQLHEELAADYTTQCALRHGAQRSAHDQAAQRPDRRRHPHARDPHRAPVRPPARRGDRVAFTRRRQHRPRSRP